MSTNLLPLTRRKTIVLLLLAVSILAAYPVAKVWQIKTTQRRYTPCEQQLLRVDTIVSQLPVMTRIGLTNFPTTDVLKPYITNGDLPTCPEGGIIKIGLSNLATHCTKHGAVLQPAPKPKNTGLIDGILQSIPFFRSCYQPAGNACIANLKQMDGAAQQWALENHKEDKDEIDVTAAASYLKGGYLPTCPQGGKYWFTVVSNAPCCTIIGHSLP